MKKIILVITIILLLTGCNERTLPKEEEIDETSNKNYTLEITKTPSCKDQIKEYHQQDNRTIYFVCIDEITLKRKNAKDMTLKYHLQKVNQTFDDSIKQLVSDIDDIEYLKDGGTKIYKHKDYTIILCNKIDGNKDIYIGNPNMEYKENYCINK